MRDETRGARVGRIAVGFWAGLVALSPGPAATQELDALQREVESIVAEYRGRVGVAVRHIETGAGFAIRGDERFPLASVYKVPMMVEVFRLAEAGELSLDERIELRPSMYNPWGSVMSRFDPGLEPTVRDLVFWMIVETDNMATDILLERIGAANVTRTMRELGWSEIRVDRSTRELILAYYGHDLPEHRRLVGMELARLAPELGRLTAERAELARRHAPLPEAVVAYVEDERDKGSPRHVNELMAAIFEGRVVSPAASREMIGILLQTRTGTDKIPGLLPAGTPVAHKTGDWPAANNDAGIIYLPGGRGHVALTVLDTHMNEPIEASSRMIARIARAVYEHFAGPAAAR